jgi:hypothetical protein
MTNEKRWEFLASWNPNQLNIERSPHNSSYETVETWLKDTVDCDNPWCEPLDGEREKIIATKSLWTLQVYPSTPIGFYAVCASSLEALIDWAMEQKDIREEVSRRTCWDCKHEPSGKCFAHQS